MCISQNNEKLSKRAKRKYLNIPLIKHLINLESPLKEKYELTLGCSSAIKLTDGKVVSRYCKRAWCNVCNPIKVAIRLNAYSPVLLELPGLHMTTLTMPNVPAGEIYSSIQIFRKHFRQFRNTWKKRTGNVLRGVYNFECTYNHRTGLYHPHIHIIHEEITTYKINQMVLDKRTGKYQQENKLLNDLITYWLDKMPACNILAQDTRPCTNLIEGFKYQALSIFKIKINGKKQPFIPVAELDIIYRSLVGVRCFQPFGIRRVVQDEDEEMDKLTAYESDKPEGVYLWKVYDWVKKMFYTDDGEYVSYDTGEYHEQPLSEFIPSKQIAQYHDKLTRNEHYSTKTITVYQQERICTVPKTDVQQSDQATLFRLLANCRQGKAPKINEPGHT